MRDWLVQNKEWIFSGVGIAAIAAVWWLVKKILTARSGPFAAPAPVNTVMQAPNITVPPTFNFRQEPRSSEPPRQEPPATPPVPLARANLKIEATKLGQIHLYQDIWTLGSGVQSTETPFRGLFVDVANVPTPLRNIKAVTVKAVLTIQSRSYSPLPWLDEYTNAVRLEPASRKTAILAIGQDRPMGSWHFVLNHRDNHNSLNPPSRMDWTNMAPIPSGMPLEILLVDLHSGELIAKFDYIWTFDANLNWPILKTPNYGN